MVIKSPQLKLKFHPNDAILSISNNDATGCGYSNIGEFPGGRHV